MFKQNLKKVTNNEGVLLFIGCIAVFSYGLALCSRLILALALLVAALTGILLPVFLFIDGKHIPNILTLFTKNNGRQTVKDIEVTCRVCEEKCKTYRSYDRHRGTNGSLQFEVPISVDVALEEFLNHVLDNYIYSWYKEISVHDQLADEIRFTIRYASCKLGSRLTKVDLTDFILRKLLPAITSHLDTYIEGSGRVRGPTTTESAVINYLSSGNGLHRALLSREDEADYLRGVISCVMPYLLPRKYQSSQIVQSFLTDLMGSFLIMEGMDFLASPDTVNRILLFLLSQDGIPYPETPGEEQVLLLKNFASVNTHSRNSNLKHNLSTVMKDQNLLKLFYSFLKEEGAANVLHFCLSVEEFNKHILDPEVTEKQAENLHSLHSEALHLYKTFIDPSSKDKLDFCYHIVSSISKIILSDVSSIVRLRETRPLFQAYEYAYKLLEDEYLTHFLSSQPYFAHLCGSRTSQSYQRNSARDVDPPKENVGKVVAKRVGTSLKHLGKQISLKPSVVIGTEDSYSCFEVDEAADITSILMSEETSELESRSGIESITHGFRDLSAWRVCIPRVEAITKDKKLSYAFIVDVSRIDVAGENLEEMHWQVKRHYHEFYILEAKLTEFHGEFLDNQLPPRGSVFISRGLEFMQSRRKIFEEFLQKLLQKPSLKGSQLLFLFLKTRDEFTASYLPDVSLGRLLRDVPRKLVKERGQHLDCFIPTFFSSTSSVKPPVYDGEEASFADSVPLLFPHTPSRTQDIYEDNAASLPPPYLDFPCSPHTPVHITGVLQTVVFVAVRVYGLSLNSVRWFTCLRVLMGSTADAVVEWFLRRKIQQALMPPQIVKIIHLVRDALFSDPSPKQTAAEAKHREDLLQHKVFSLVPTYIQQWLFTKEHYAGGVDLLVNLFQHPILNKQLSYILLDLVIAELFPELRVNQDS